MRRRTGRAGQARDATQGAASGGARPGGSWAHRTQAITRPVGALSISAIQDMQGFESLADEWDVLVRAMAQPSPYLLHGYVWASWRHYVGKGSVAILCARREGKLVAGLPLVIRRQSMARVAKLLCGAYAGVDLPLSRTEPLGTAEQLLSCARELPFDFLRLNGLEPGACISAAVEAAGEKLEEEEEGAPTLTIEDSWEQTYARNTSSKTRNLHRRRWRQLAQLGSLEVELARSREELEVALDEAVRLHRLRWEGSVENTSDFGTARGSRFQGDVLRGLARTDTARIALLRLDGRAIAFHYYFVLEGTMFVHRLAFDPEFGDHSPGVLTTLRAIELAAAEGVTRVDFGRGEERYKLQLADSLQPLAWGTCLVDGRRGRRAVARARLLDAVRLRLKRSNALTRAYRTARTIRRQASA